MIKYLLLFFIFITPSFAELDSKTDYRYCTNSPIRDDKGVIIRSFSVKYAFRKLHPCPVNSDLYGACPGWSIDHVIPLVCGGCDSVYNMQWLPNEIKSCAGTICKDRWERKIYCK